MALPRARETATNEIDTLFERLWNDFMAPSFPVRFETALYTPAVDLYEKDGAFVVEMSVPGYKREDIDVEVNGTLLTISGKYGEAKTEEGAKYHYRQIRRGAFARTIMFCSQNCCSLRNQSTRVHHKISPRFFCI